MSMVQKVHLMLGNESLWQVATQCHHALAEAQIPHSVCGGVAVCLHGYQRNTIDLGLIVRRTDSAAVRTTLEHAGLSWHEEQAEFRSSSGIPVQFPYSGDRAGKGAEFSLPDPEGDQNVETVENLPVLRLSKLIEIKIACGLDNLRRTHKDFADVVELIVVRNLDSSFARFIHKSVRQTFLELLKNARG
jgi:hypothetical protein